MIPPRIRRILFSALVIASPSMSLGSTVLLSMNGDNPVVGQYRTDSRGIFGSPEVVDANQSPDHFNSKSYKFRGDQIYFDMYYPVYNSPPQPFYPDYNVYNISFDFTTDNLLYSNDVFKVFMDVPSIRYVEIERNGVISEYSPDAGKSELDRIQDLHDYKIHFDIEYNLLTNTVTYNREYTNSYGASWSLTSTSDFFMDTGTVYEKPRGIRFSHSDYFGASSYPATSDIYLDNIVISASEVPAPASLYLFSSAIVGFGLLKGRKEVSRS